MSKENRKLLLAAIGAFCSLLALGINFGRWMGYL